MNGFFITISNGLLTKQHREAIGPAIWVFMWCLDRMTKIDHDNGEGLVFGGEPFEIEVIASELQFGLRTVKEHLDILREHGYIETTHENHGITIKVFKAKKVYGLPSGKKPSAETRTLKEEPSADLRIAKCGPPHSALYIDNNKDSNNISNQLAEVTDEYEIVDEPDGLLPSKKPASKSKPIFEWAVKVKGLGRVRVPTQLKHINSMLEGGYTAEDIKSKWDELEKAVWITSIDFGTIVSQIGKAEVKKSAPKTFRSKDIK